MIGDEERERKPNISHVIQHTLCLDLVTYIIKYETRAHTHMYNILVIINQLFCINLVQL